MTLSDLLNITNEPINIYKKSNSVLVDDMHIVTVSNDSSILNKAGLDSEILWIDVDQKRGGLKVYLDIIEQEG